MNPIHEINTKKNSLFYKLLLSFLTIILLLLIFNFFSLTFFKNTIRDEIIKYNEHDLIRTADNYNKVFQQINNYLLHLSFDEQVQLLNKENIKSLDYVTAIHLMQQIKSDVSSNDLPFLDNILIYFSKSSFVVDKDRGSRAESMFSRYHYNKEYPLSFWKGLFDENFLTRIYPSQQFTYTAFNKVWSHTSQDIPFVIKNKLTPDFYMIALIDANKMSDSLGLSINNDFFILDHQGSRIFASRSGNVPAQLPKMTKQIGYVKYGNDFYFYRKSTVTDLTYINKIPIGFISSQIKRFDFYLISLLILTIAISIFVSVLFTVRFSNPIQKIVKSIHQLNMNTDIHTPINEFNMIHEKVKHLLENQETIHKDLNLKTSLLKYYAYMNKVKRIHNNFDDEQNVIDNKKPYVFVLFNITYKQKFLNEISKEMDRASYFIKEYVNFCMSKTYAGSCTFQIENDQILSILFIDKEEQNQITNILQKIKDILDMDQEYCFITICISLLYENSSDFTKAYEQVRDLVGLRKFNDKTQIIHHDEAVEKEEFFYFFSPTQEQEFDANFRAVNLSSVLQLIERILSSLERKEAAPESFYRFAEEIIDKMIKLFNSLNIDPHGLISPVSPFEQIKKCNTAEELLSFFEAFLADAARQMTRKKEKKDPITHFVIDYLDQHFSDEITLDLLADKLSISRGYLSTYFKEKTGKNFVDYVNQVRIHKAKQLLLNSDLKIQTVAEQVGYNNVTSFNRMFKKFSSITPSRFRQQHVILSQQQGNP